MKRNISISGRLFSITRNRAAGNTLELVVNFDHQVIALFKEVRNLIWLGFTVAHSITNVSKEAKRVYPYAVSLMETVRTFAQVNRVITEMSDVSILLSGYQNDVQNLVIKGIPLKWETFVNQYDIHLRNIHYLPNGSVDNMSSIATRESRHVQFVRDFAGAVSILQQKTQTLADIHENCQKALAELRTCPFDSETFKQKLDIIQTAVDQLNLENYVNLSHWVGELNVKIELILLSRLQEAIILWIEVFEGQKAEGVDSDIQRKRFSRISGDDQDVGNAAQDTRFNPNMKRLIHEVSIKNQVIFLDPPIEYARASWFSQLHNWIGITCYLPKLKASRYEMSMHVTTIDLDQRFSDLVSLSKVSGIFIHLLTAT